MNKPSSSNSKLSLTALFCIMIGGGVGYGLGIGAGYVAKDSHTTESLADNPEKAWKKLGTINTNVSKTDVYNLKFRGQDCVIIMNVVENGVNNSPAHSFASLDCKD